MPTACTVSTTVSPGAAISAGRALSSARAPAGRANSSKEANATFRKACACMVLSPSLREAWVSKQFRLAAILLGSGLLRGLRKHAWGDIRLAYAAIALARLSETLSRKPVVESQRWSAP